MSATDLEYTNWKLNSYEDGGAMQRLPADAEVTLTFQDGAAGGKSGCNRYRSAVTIGDDSLVFGPAMGTKMACPPPLMEIEDKYLRTLEAVSTWRISDDTLELRDGAGQVALTFSRA
jgi:heat shock protein HslJ